MCVYAKLLHLCLTFCNLMGCTLPVSSVHGFSRQEYWGQLSYPPPGDLPNPGVDPAYPEAPALQMDSLPLSHQGSPFIIYNDN